MRIVAGEFRGIPLVAPKGEHTRPTTDKVKESLFNRIAHYLDGVVVADLFGGSGGLALESISRGATHAYVFETNREALSAIRKNKEKCKTDALTIIPKTANQSLNYFAQKELTIDLLFLDPPYDQVSYYALAEQLAEANILSQQAIIVCEHLTSVYLPDQMGQFPLHKRASYGTITLSIYME